MPSVVAKVALTVVFGVVAVSVGFRDAGAPVFVIGEPPTITEMRAHGFEVRDDERVCLVHAERESPNAIHASHVVAQCAQDRPNPEIRSRDEAM